MREDITGIGNLLKDKIARFRRVLVDKLDARQITVSTIKGSAARSGDITIEPAAITDSVTISGGFLLVQLEGTPMVNTWRNANNGTVAGPIIAFARSRGTLASPASVQSGDILGQIQFDGFDPNQATGAKIVVDASQAWTSTAHGARIEFYTVDDGTTTEDLRAIIDQDGELNLYYGAKLVDTKKLLFGTGEDGEIYVSSDHLYIKNVTQDKDIVITFNDGGATKTITIDASENLINAGDTAITTTGDITAGNIVTGGNVDGVDISAWIDQDVSSGSSPTLDGTNFTGIPSAGVTDNVSADAAIVDHTIVRGHGGAKVVQDTGIVVDDADNVSSMGTLGCGAITSTAEVTGTTLEATGDTSAGDNSALGYTATEGAILTGQGSTSDVTVKNDADAEVFSVPTGTTGVHFVGHISVNDAPSNDTAAGITAELTAGAALSYGDMCYVGADGRMEKTDADAIATSYCVAVCVESGGIAGDGTAGTFLLHGFIEHEFDFGTVGAPVFLDTATAGGVTTTAPSGASDTVVVVGISYGADLLYFNPSQQGIVEHTG